MKPSLQHRPLLPFWQGKTSALQLTYPTMHIPTGLTVHLQSVVTHMATSRCVPSISCLQRQGSSASLRLIPACDYRSAASIVSAVPTADTTREFSLWSHAAWKHHRVDPLPLSRATLLANNASSSFETNFSYRRSQAPSRIAVTKITKTGRALECQVGACSRCL
ncbi:hypothetical protein HDV62DRAFT_339334 [Trichoderma sp. SZMC 28011]